MALVIHENKTASKKSYGTAITDGLRSFNEWRDEFLIEASTLFLMLGFIAGTVDVFTKGGLSSNANFTIAWATVQAVAIDGLFFAVWGKVARATWTRATWFKNAMLILVGLLLAVVATLVNGILSYQELMDTSNVKEAMVKLGVDQAAFTYSRSILVVLVAILVALFCRSKQQASEDSPAITTDIAQASPVQPVQATQITEDSPVMAMAISEASPVQPVQATQITEDSPVQPIQAMAISEQAENMAHGPDTDGDIIAFDVATMAMAASHRDRIKAIMQNNGDGLSYGDIARLAGVGYSTVKKHAPAIREELQQAVQ